MSKNMYCSNQKSNSKDYNDNFDRIFKTASKIKILTGSGFLMDKVLFVDKDFKPVGLIKDLLVPCSSCGSRLDINRSKWAAGQRYMTCEGCKTVLDIGTYPGVRP